MLTILIQCLTKVTTEQPLEKRHTTHFIHNFLHSNKRLPKKKHTAEILFAYDLVWPWLSYNDALYCFKLLWFKIGHAFNGGSLSLCVCCVWNVNALLSDDCCLGQWLFFSVINRCELRFYSGELFRRVCILCLKCGRHASRLNCVHILCKIMR